MEQQHPIPQQISSYQFRLVGDMTLKQFFLLSGGALVALIFYASPLHPLIKWPAIIFFSLLGAALAFLPFEERPLEKWIIAFFRSIYAPTIFVWKKTITPQRFFRETAPPEEKIITPSGAKKAEVYLSTPQKGYVPETLEQGEANFLKRIAQLFSSQPIPAASSYAKQQLVPEDSLQTYFSSPSPAPIIRPRIIVEETSGPQTPSSSTYAVPITPSAPVITGQKSQTPQAPQFSPEAILPGAPTVANTVGGLVTDTEGKIVEGAILEIRDASGRPVRALKTNKLGHFVIITPLFNGSYEIISEKDGLEFSPIVFEAKGEIIPPVLIKARKAVPKQDVN